MFSNEKANDFSVHYSLSSLPKPDKNDPRFENKPNQANMRTAVKLMASGVSGGTLTYLTLSTSTLPL